MDRTHPKPQYKEKNKMSELTLKDHISGNVTFTKYKQGHLYYQTSTGLEFPVPVEDTGEADFLASDKGIYFMRYIRKHLSNLQNQD